jgi:hypothetical protein
MSGHDPVLSSPALDLIIIGAPRSGTNMLRDSLCRLPGFGTWPCDEINYIWRHGNARHPSDELPPGRADARVVRYIRRAFARRRRIERCEVVVEKTCANSLRVPFVDRVLPDARYVFIHRDPLDAVASSILRWNAPLDLTYTLAKARFVPLTDLPYYGLRFLRNRLHRLASGQARLASWGPRLQCMDEILRAHTVAEVCAHQWRECLLRSVAALAAMPADKVCRIRYEELVRAPGSHLAEICHFLGRTPDRERLEAAVSDVSSRSIGKGRQQLSKTDRQAVERIIEPASTRLEALVAAGFR